MTSNIDRVWNWYWLVAIQTFCTAILFAIGMWWFADHRIDYCYVVHQSRFKNDTYLLRGNRPWDEDERIGEFKTIDEAAAGAKAINCPMGVR